MWENIAKRRKMPNVPESRRGSFQTCLSHTGTPSLHFSDKKFAPIIAKIGQSSFKLFFELLFSPYPQLWTKVVILLHSSISFGVKLDQPKSCVYSLLSQSKLFERVKITFFKLGTTAMPHARSRCIFFYSI